MRMLINDLMQNSDAPSELISAALADDYLFTTVDIDLGSSLEFDSIGIGYTDATTITITAGAEVRNITYTENGLYLFSSITAQNVTISHNGSYIGRVALGKHRKICTIPAKEPGFYSTENNRITTSGQVISGAGGYSGRTMGVDIRYKIDEDVYNDFLSVYNNQTAKQLPFFLYFLEESHKLPFDMMYGGFDNTDLTFQNAINRFLYSIRMDFIERF